MAQCDEEHRKKQTLNTSGEQGKEETPGNTAGTDKTGKSKTDGRLTK